MEKQFNTRTNRINLIEKQIKVMENYYQVILKSGKTHKSLYRTIPNAIKNVGVENIKQIKEIRSELVDNRYLEQVGKGSIE
jgi:archaellum component FlaC